MLRRVPRTQSRGTHWVVGHREGGARSLQRGVRRKRAALFAPSCVPGTGSGSSQRKVREGRSGQRKLAPWPSHQPQGLVPVLCEQDRTQTGLPGACMCCHLMCSDWPALVHLHCTFIVVKPHRLQDLGHPPPGSLQQQDVTPFPRRHDDTVSRFSVNSSLAPKINRLLPV